MATAWQTLTSELTANGILCITLNRPDKLNALNQTMLAELDSLLVQASDNRAVKALLITGQGKAFCAGADINELAALNANTAYHFAKRGQAVFSQLENLAKPSVAAINGFAFGGGCELALAASIRLAAEIAQFGQPEVKLGVIPGFGGTQRLARLVGKGRALDLCLTGRPIKADEAQQWGLVSSIVPADQLLDHAHDVLKSLLKNGPLALANTLRVIHQGFDLPLADALELEANQFALSCASQDKQIGVEAFLAKQDAVFTGE